MSARIHRAQLFFDFDALEPLLALELPELAWTNELGVAHIVPAATGERVAELLEVSRRQVCRWRAGAPLSSKYADRAATALGLHPRCIWQRWDELHDDAAERARRAVNASNEAARQRLRQAS